MAEPAESPMAIPKIPVDSLSANPVARVIGIAQGEALEDAELCLDQIQPRGLGRYPHWRDPKPTQQSPEAGMVVDVAEVVHDYQEPLARVTGSQAAEGLADLDDAFAPTKQPAEAVGVDIIEAQELLGAVRAPISGAHAGGPAARRPGDSPDGAQFEGAPLVEADYCRPPRALPIEPADAFFFRSKAGS